jgi:hypothetical protein
VAMTASDSSLRAAGITFGNAHVRSTTSPQGERVQRTPIGTGLSLGPTSCDSYAALRS